MSTNWQQPAKAWEGFLRDLLTVRDDLICTYKNAWYRGHSSSAYGLWPTLLRPDLPARRSEQIDRDVVKPMLKQQIRAHVDRLKWLRANEPANLDAIGDHVRLKSHLDTQIVQINQQATASFVRGEREAFREYAFRAGWESSTSSWTILAEMRHLGIPTRLLDWTESLDTALAFAVQPIATALNELWTECENAKQLLKKRALHYLPNVVVPRLRTAVAGDQFPCFLGEHFPEPCVWVLNPYTAGQAALDQASKSQVSLKSHSDHRYQELLDQLGTDRVVLNFDRMAELDYERCFVHPRAPQWPFELPIPAHVSWIHPYHKAQRGQFTIHGTKRDAVNELLSSHVVRPVPLPVEAACYWVRTQRVSNESWFLKLFPSPDMIARDVADRFVNTVSVPCWLAKLARGRAIECNPALAGQSDFEIHQWLTNTTTWNQGTLAELKEYRVPAFDMWKRRLAIAGFVYH